MLKARQEFIQNNINESIKAKEKALEAQESIDLKINDANIKVSNLILEAKSESEKIINDGMQKAQKQSELLLQQANILVEKKYKDFELEQKKIIIENAVELARKILKRELKDKDNKKLISELMEN
jgi:ATP synthase B/B'' CF(0).